jgi:hypothetical protein
LHDDEAMINHKVIRPIFALSVGLVLSFYVYQCVSDRQPTLQRTKEESVVMLSRDILQNYVSPRNDIEIVDPVSSNRSVGKAYIYPINDGWEISGHYRRDQNDRWHPYLMILNGDAELISLTVQDTNDSLIGISARDQDFSVVQP